MKQKSTYFRFISLLFFAVFFSVSLQAQIFIKYDATGLNNGSSWTNAYTNLESALSTAVAGNKIYIAAGKYLPTQQYDFATGLPTTGQPRQATFKIPNNVEVYGGFEGTETSFTQTDLDNRDFDAHTTILSGDLGNNDNVTGTFPNLRFTNISENSFRVVYTRRVDSNTKVDGVTITGASSSGNNIVNPNNGSGWYNDGSQSMNSSNPTLLNIIFIRNNTGLFNNGVEYGSSSPSITNCSFIQNERVGLNNYGASNGTSSPFVKNCSFVQNKSSGIQNWSAWGGLSSPTIINCLFSENMSFRGGAIYNNAHQDRGITEPTIINCLFFKNVADEAGGAIYNEVYDGKCIARIINCSFYGNISPGQGSVIFSFTLATYAHYYRPQNSFQMVNSIIWNNSGRAIYNDDPRYSNPTISNSLIQESSLNSDINDGGNNIFGQDPLFVCPESGDLRLKTNSPAINVGSNLAIDTTGVSTDFANDQRIFNTIVDMGAYEYSIAPSITEINILGNGISIVNNDITPDTSDDTHWGNVNGSRTVSYTIQNTGNITLNVSSIRITGLNAGDYTLSNVPSFINAGSSATFDITLLPRVPSRVGIRRADVTVYSDDCNNGIYKFSILGIIVLPEINVRGNGITILNGSSSTTITNGTYFGDVVECNNNTITKNFTIQNLSTGTLNINNIVMGFDFFGTGVADFSINNIPTTIAANSSEEFSVTFDPSQLGSRSGRVIIYNNDLDEGTYSFYVSGYGIAGSQTPIIPTLVDITAQCSVPSITPPTATDNCAGTITGTTTTIFPITTQGTTVVTWNFDDGNGNISTANQNVIITDTQIPVVPILVDITAQCSVPSITPPTATDNCIGTITGTTTTIFPITTQGTTVVTWNFDDGNGNISTANQNVIITDTQTPVAPTLVDITAQCSVSSITPPTATDNCAGTITGTTTTIFPITTQGTTVVMWTFDDGNGNISTANQNVIITDTEIPTIIAPSNITANTDTGICTASNVTLGTPTGTDNCGTVSFTNNAPTNFPIGTTTVIWTANDGNGNTATATQTVTISDAKEINLLGNAVSILDGSTTTSTNDNTDFGDVGNSRTITYTLENTGIENITISSITSNNTDFVISAIPTTVLAGSTSDFSVTFSSTNLGLSSAIITINNNDCDESVYDFAIQATKINVTPPPPPAPIEANLKLNAVAVSSTRINLNWTINTQATSYLLYRNERFVEQIATTLSTYSDKNLTPDTFYQYKLIAVINSVNSLPSSDNEWTLPEKPTLLSLSSVCGNGGKSNIKLTATGSIYRVYDQLINGTLLLESINGSFELPYTNQTTTFYVSVVGNSGKESERLAVNVEIQMPFESVILGEDGLIATTQSSCTNALLLKAQEVENATYYTWFWNEIQVNTGTELMATRSGDYQLRITKGSCSYVSEKVKVILNQTPSAQIKQNRTNYTRNFCDNTVLNAVETSANNTLNATYQWKFNDVVIGQTPNLEVSESGTYSLLVSTPTCTDNTSIEVIITEKPQIPILKATQDSICKDNETTLFVENIENEVNYLWFRNGRILSYYGSSITTNQKGEYRVSAIPDQNVSCNSVSNSIQINHFADFVVYLRENKESNSIYLETLSSENEITNVEWYFEGELKTELGNSLEIVPTEKGYYSAKVTSQNGCVFQTRTVYFTPSQAPITGEEDIKSDAFKIYPNPNNGIFKVAFETVLLENTEVIIFDGIGRKIHTQTFEKGNQEFIIDVKNQSKGMYLIHFNQNDKVYSKQIIIE